MRPPKPKTLLPTTALVSYYAYSGGFRWHWRQSADTFPGQPVVLVHGLVATSLALSPLAEAVTGWARVLAPDLPGFGLSTGSKAPWSVPEMAAALAEWMRGVGAAPAHLVGLSFGSQIAAEVAVRYPAQVRSLTLVGPTLDPDAREWLKAAARLGAELHREPLRLWRGEAAIPLPRPRHCVAALRSLLCHRIEGRLPLLRLPALAVRGGFDPIAPEGWVREAARLTPGAAALTLPEGAHGVHCTHPALVAGAVRNFTFALRHAP